MKIKEMENYFRTHNMNVCPKEMVIETLKVWKRLSKYFGKTCTHNTVVQGKWFETAVECGCHVIAWNMMFHKLKKFELCLIEIGFDEMKKGTFVGKFHKNEKGIIEYAHVRPQL